MELPPREPLLDVAWLAAFQAEHGSAAFQELLRQAAEAYDGPITAIAATLLTPPMVRMFMDRFGIDVARTLSHRLLTSSWSSAPEGPVGATFPGPWMSSAMDEWYVKRGQPPPPTLPVPRLADLRLRRPLDGAWLAHRDGIWGCDASPDGRYMISGSRDRTLAVWDLERGVLVSRVIADHGDVRDCLFSPDGSRLVSVHADGRVIVWTTDTMQELFATSSQLPRGHPTYHWRRVAISPDASRLAIAGWNGAVDFWDFDRLEQVVGVQLELTTEPLGVFLPSAATCITVGRGPTAQVLFWDVQVQEVTTRHEVEMPTDYVRTAVLSPANRLLVASTAEDTFVWELGKAEPVAHASGGIAGRAIGLSSDGSMVATSDNQKFVRLRTLPDLKEVVQWYLPDLGCADIACAVAFTPEDSHLLLAGWEGVIRRIVLPIRR